MKPRPAHALAAAALLTLAACGPKSESGGGSAGAGGGASTPTGATNAQTTYAQMPAPMQDLLDCAGAFAAAGGIDPASRSPDLRNPWFPAYMGALSQALNMTGSASGMEASDAVIQRAAFWKGQAAPARTARAEGCKAKYPPKGG